VRRARVGVVISAAFMMAVACGSVASTPRAADRGAQFLFTGNPSAAARQQTLAAVQARAEKLGGSAHLVGDEIVVDVPGGAGMADELVAPGHLGFRPVLATYPADDGAVTTSGVPRLTPPGAVEPTQPAVLAQRDSTSGKITAIYALGPEAASGANLESASADLSQMGQWEVRPVFRAGAQGIDPFNQVASACYAGDPSCPTKQVAIVLDGAVLTAPAIDNQSFERDQITISGGFTEQSARVLAAALETGPLSALLAPVSPGNGGTTGTS
jgi:preprotein translocase subunit SecD